MRHPTITQRFCIGIVRAYQQGFSALCPMSCRFVPSCSWFSIEAIEKYGVIKGLWLTFGRLLRCQPFASSGLDPVPPPTESRWNAEHC